MDISPFFQGKSIIVTGGVGSVGREVVHQLAQFDVSCIRVIDNNESGLFEMEQSCADDPRLEFYHCDICDEREMMRTFSGMNYCFHAAGLKHVPSCERNPFGAVNVNVLGAENVIQAAFHNDLDRVLFTSSDKAVNPTSVMGTSKLLAERIFSAANFLRSERHKTVFFSTRFGNVAGSRGSVIPLFCEQIRRGGPVTLTDDRMSRFMMSINEAGELVIQSIALARGGEVFITKMPVLNIKELAERLICLLAPLYGHDPADISIEIVGSRPGEKLWEELSTDEESRRLLESDRYLIVLPALAPGSVRNSFTYEHLTTRESCIIYHSHRQPKCTAKEIDRFLMQPGVLPESVRAVLVADHGVSKAAVGFQYQRESF